MSSFISSSSFAVVASSLKTDGAGGVVMSRKREKSVRIETAGSLGCESQLFIKPKQKNCACLIFKIYGRDDASGDTFMLRRLHNNAVAVMSVANFYVFY